MYRQPGCTARRRATALPRKQGIEFESIDVLDGPDGMERLGALGGRCTLRQSLDDVRKFLDRQTFRNRHRTSGDWTARRIAPDGPLTAEPLAGLPVPDEVWDR